LCASGCWERARSLAPAGAAVVLPAAALLSGLRTLDRPRCPGFWDLLLVCSCFARRVPLVDRLFPALSGWCALRLDCATNCDIEFAG